MKKSLLLVIIFLSPFTFHLSPVSSQTINIMSYNLRSSAKNEQDGVNSWTNRKEAAIKMINAIQPDVIGFQEEMNDQEAYLREHLSPKYDGVSVQRDPANKTDEACAIFFRTDRYELIRTNTFWLSETPDVPSKGWDAKYNRVVTYVFLRDKKSGLQLLAFNTHLDHKGVVARERSLQLIADSALAIGGDIVPMFIMGDLNVEPDAPELQPMWNTMLWSQREAFHTDTTGTFHSFGRAKRLKIIDYIFYKNATALRFDIIRDGYGVPYLSDHYPVLGTFSRDKQLSKTTFREVEKYCAEQAKQQKRRANWARLNYYAAANDTLRLNKQKVSVIFYGNSITRNWAKMHPDFFTNYGFTGRGIGGQTSDELLVRFRQDVIDLHPKTVVIMVGTNDIAQNNGTTSHQQTLGNIISMCELAKANKIKPVLCSVLPSRQFRWNKHVPDAAAQIKELNGMIKAYAGQHKITYVDYWSVMAAEDGGLKPGLSNDEVHPLPDAYDIMESIILKALRIKTH